MKVIQPQSGDFSYYCSCHNVKHFSLGDKSYLGNLFNPFRYGLSDQRIGMGGGAKRPPPVDIDQIMDFANFVFTGAQIRI